MDTPPPLSPPATDSNDKLIAILCHVSAFLGVGFVLPLIVYLVKKDAPGNVGEHAKEVLNFHITLIIYGIIACILILVLIGFVLLGLIAVASLVLSIVGAIKASEGTVYHYPMTLRLIK